MDFLSALPSRLQHPLTTGHWGCSTITTVSPRGTDTPQTQEAPASHSEKWDSTPVTVILALTRDTAQLRRLL